jgi:tetratricopeptide (TPR) repeat protein
MSVRRGHPIVAVGAVIALGCAIGLQVIRDRQFPREARDTGKFLYVQSGTAVDRMVLDFDALAADVYWIRALQAYGGERLTKTRARTYDLLYPFLDLATSLDPYFTIAYRFGAIFLSEPYPGGPGRPDQAVALLRKGLAKQPTKWQYYHDIAFVHYWHMRDYKAAASWFQRAAEQPGAPNWLGPLVPVMLNASGDRSSARLLWQHILESDQEWLRRLAERRLQQLDALDIIDELERIVRANPPPAGGQYSWRWLISQRVLPGIPADPTRTPYVIDPTTGKVSVSATSELQPMPDQSLRPPS